MTERGPKVFVTQSTLARGESGEWNPKFNLSPAAAFGELVFLFGHGPVALMTREMRDAILSRLDEEGFDPETDIVLCIGDSTIGFNLGMIIGSRYGDSARVIRWDRNRGAYDLLTCLS